MANLDLGLKDHKVFHLYVCYKNGTPFGPEDKILGPEASLALRVFYDYFLRPKGVSFRDFCAEVMVPMAHSKDPEISLKLDPVLKAIQQEEGLNVTFVLSLDEIQEVFPAQIPIQKDRSAFLSSAHDNEDFENCFFLSSFFYGLAVALVSHFPASK